MPGRRRGCCRPPESGIKTSGVPLESEQVSRYLDLAREHGFDGLLTISNQIRSDPESLPCSVRKQKLHGLAVYLLSDTPFDHQQSVQRHSR